MRKLLLSLLGVIVSITIANAGKVTEQQALQKAQQFMKGKNLSMANTRSLSRGNSNGNDAFYIFNAENDGGFVIVSGDDRTTEILGYSDHGNINFSRLPDNLEWLLRYYQHMIGNLDNQTALVKMKHSTRFVQTEARSPIEPFIKTHWGQGEPYNSLCPLIDGKHAVTGCVATAMAQIINYCKCPEGQTEYVEKYTTMMEGITMPQLEPTSFDWDNMTDGDIARLMLYCGQSVKMDYGLDESGAYMDDAPYRKVFGFSKAVRSIGRDLMYYHDDNLWEGILYDELAAGRPVCYQGGLPGHAMVFDGFRDGFFHVNWGWDGDFDGYYVITGIGSEDFMHNYEWNQWAIIGLMPPVNEQTLQIPKVFVTYMGFFCETTYENKGYISRANVSEDFPAFYVSSELCTDIVGKQEIGLGLLDNNGNIICLVNEQHSFNEDELYIYENYVSIRKNTPDGDYRLVSIWRNSESEDWQLAMEGKCNYLEITIDGLDLVVHIIPDGTKSKDYKEVGVKDIDGVTYLLYSDYDNNLLAKVYPYKKYGKYSGDVVVPSKVEYEGKIYRVYYETQAFVNCEDLLSLSVANTYIESIGNCPKLSQLTIGEGVVHCNSISLLPSLETIELPSTLIHASLGFISDCENLRTIRFKGSMVRFTGVPNWEDSSLPSLTDIYFPSATPPIVESNIDYGERLLDDIPSNSKAKIHIPIGSLPLYKKSNWRLWNFVEDLPAASHVTWSYCHSDAVSDSGEGVTSQNNDVEYAMRVPAEEMKVYKGKQIKQIQVYSPPCPPNDYQIEDYEYVYITKQGTDYLIKQPFSVIRGVWNTIELETPYEITGEELYVGVGKHGQIGVNYADMTEIEGATWGRAMGEDYNCIWKPKKWTKLGNKTHPIPIRFTIEGESMPEGLVLRELELVETGTASLSRSMTRGEGNAKLQGVIRNRSLTPVTSYTVEWTIDGTNKDSKTFDTYLIPNATETITIELPETVLDGYHVIKTDVISMNETENELAGFNMPSLEIGEYEAVTSVDINISSAKQVPYCSQYDLDFTDKPELKAYVATGYDKAAGTIWLTRVKQVPANTGFLLVGDAGDYDIPVAESAADCYYKNMFKGTINGTTIYTTDGKYTNYYLSKGDKGVGFYKVTKEEGQSIGANRCYLPILTEIPAFGSEGNTVAIKVSAAKQLPYYTSTSLDFTSLDATGVKAYTATGYNYSSGTIWLSRVKKVPAKTGVLIMANEAGDYDVPTASVAATFENMFAGSETAQTIQTIETIDGVDYVNYYLSNGTNGVGFYKVTNADGQSMGANRCYLQIPKREKASGARGDAENGTPALSNLIFSDEGDDIIAIPVYGSTNGEDDGTTGIDNNNREPITNNVWYNLQGQRVDKPGKGIYIHNGKVIVRK